MIIEIFDCGHGHYSLHEHSECQICHIGKPESRWNVEVVEGGKVCKKYWPAEAVEDEPRAQS